MKLCVNDKVIWECAAGIKSGKIIDMELSLNAAKQVVPWLFVRDSEYKITCLCATDENLKMLGVKKLK